jgi:signal transduction histidine kinase
MAHNLRPGLLDELGLTKAVRAMVQKVAQASGIPIVVGLADVDGLLPPEAELNLFRITQEALNNVLKHAHASEVKVNLTREVAGLKLVVEDNGCGFEPDEPEPAAPDRRGVGLQQITVRARMIAGQVNVKSRPGQGTRLIVELPVNKGFKNDNRQQPQAS